MPQNGHHKNPESGPFSGCLCDEISHDGSRVTQPSRCFGGSARCLGYAVRQQGLTQNLNVTRAIGDSMQLLIFNIY